MTIDPVELTQSLVRCPSVTPEEGGALVLLEKLLDAHGFTCTRVDRAETSNLFARWGSGKTLGFNGHTDVVPVGAEGDWTHPPFEAIIKGDMLYGRGTADMKSGVAAFAAAAIDFVTETPPDGSIVLAITGDEEGVATDGTIAILDWMDANNEKIDHCLVGEPTCPNKMGEMMKIGRRGSMTAYITATGVQGHSAYPHRAKNPVPAIARLTHELASMTLDEGTDHFDPSTLAVTTIDVGNPANNVIPAEARATLNIRFNDAHSSSSLTSMIEEKANQIAQETGITFAIEYQVSGESFVTEPSAFSDMIAKAVEAETGLVPTASTSGGTSDARFIKDHCPVVEFGLVGKTMHQVDEAVPVAEIHQLKSIYSRILRTYFT
ncbi:MAG: succinyl-diaminopimelate desuccinylase [Pseudomonadota bacterium]